MIFNTYHFEELANTTPTILGLLIVSILGLILSLIMKYYKKKEKEEN